MQSTNRDKGIKRVIFAWELKKSGMTYAEIGRVLGLSRERARQLVERMHWRLHVLYWRKYKTKPTHQYWYDLGYTINTIKNTIRQ